MKEAQPRRRIGGGALFGAGCLALFLLLFGSVLIGKRVMVAGDVLYTIGPWSGTPGPHSTHNAWVGDGVTVFLPWLMLVREAFASGRLPLWNPYALFGAPLLANGQSAPFSPFTLFAVVFGGTRGMSLAMLAKLWVAGIGTFVFVRRLGVGRLGAILGGLAFATSSFMVVWLQGQGSSVAALLPWVFAAAEWYVQAPRGRRLGVLALAIGLQFLAGQPDASLYLCLGVALYGVVRCAGPGHRAALPGLAAAAVVGVLVASVQVVPFAVFLRQSGAVAARAGQNLGFSHLPVTYLDSWLAPNIHGNPAIDGREARATNYNEGTGFVGVAVLTLAAPGLVYQWKRDRSTLVALVVVGLVSFGAIYGALSPVFGRLPGFASAQSTRMLMLACFVVACFGGVGLDGLSRRGRRAGLSARALTASAVGLVALAAVVAGAVLFRVEGARVESLGPALPRGWIPFWAAFGAVCLVAAVALAAAAWFRMPRTSATGLAVLALVEAAVFAGPFQPQLPPSEVPPPSAAMNWLVAHAGDRPVAAQGFDMQPEVTTLYGLHDARGYENTQSPRVSIFWSHADPFFKPPEKILTLGLPNARWLAAAGVSYYMTSGNAPLPGTVTVFQGDGVTISRVPGARPFAFAAPSVGWVASPQQAATRMAPNPLGTVYLEGSGSSQAGPATVTVASRQAGTVKLDVHAIRPAEIVVLQSYAPGWSATVDGRPAGVVPADVLFQAVRVPAGRHRVTLTYRPASVSVGLGLSGIGLLLMILFFVFNPELSRIPVRHRGRRLESRRLRGDAGEAAHP